MYKCQIHITLYILKNIALHFSCFLSCLTTLRTKKEEKDRSLIHQKTKSKFFHKFNIIKTYKNPVYSISKILRGKKFLPELYWCILIWKTEWWRHNPACPLLLRRAVAPVLHKGCSPHWLPACAAGIFPIN